MPRHQGVPAELKQSPITVAEAEQAGLTRHQLKAPNWRRIARGWYVWRGVADSPAHRLQAVAKTLPEASAFCGLTAAWLHGSDPGIKGGLPLLTTGEVEITVPHTVTMRPRAGLRVAGLPRPHAQVSIHDSNGGFAGRVDLYYPQTRLGIEYDGDTHRSRLIEDNHRQNRLYTAGVSLLRYTSFDVFEEPGSIVRQVRAALSDVAGARTLRSDSVLRTSTQVRVALMGCTSTPPSMARQPRPAGGDGSGG